jgi:hypothetical protein
LKIKLDGKLFEMEDDMIEDLISEKVILKIDDTFKKIGGASSLIQSVLNGLLSSNGFKKIEGLTLIESALVEIVSSIITESKGKVIDLAEHGIMAKEVVEEKNLLPVESEGEQND